MYTFILCSLIPPQNLASKRMYLKWRNPHIYKQYGYGLYVRESPTHKTVVDAVVSTVPSK